MEDDRRDSGLPDIDLQLLLEGDQEEKRKIEEFDDFISEIF
jgi:hypothetical protein